jgi:hypothetical protein
VKGEKEEEKKEDARRVSNQIESDASLRIVATRTLMCS